MAWTFLYNIIILQVLKTSENDNNCGIHYLSFIDTCFLKLVFSGYIFSFSLIITEYHFTFTLFPELRICKGNDKINKTSNDLKTR